MIRKTGTFLTVFFLSFFGFLGYSQVIPGSYVVQLLGECDSSCQGTLQGKLNDNPNTQGCVISGLGTMIGDLTFQQVTCPESALSASSSSDDNAVEDALMGGISALSGVSVQIVQPDFVVSTTQESTSLWGVDEADGGVEREGGNPVRDGLRTCSAKSNNGKDVNVWVLDTGCTPSSGGFCEGYYGGSNVCQDDNGHGNHVAGTVNHPTYGVAPSATVSCVKVLSDSGSGSFANIIKGISYVTENRKAMPKGDVINMSLGGSKYDPVNNAVNEASKLGIVFTLSAGNSAQNACNQSPASATGRRVFTVQAHDKDLKAASFTNYAEKGLSCTDLSAPGVAILSEGGLKSGTSMAAPHVAGACAILMSDGSKPNKKKLTANSVKIKLKGLKNRKTLGLACP